MLILVNNEKRSEKNCYSGFGLATAMRTPAGLAEGEARWRHLTSDHSAHGHPCRESCSPLAILAHQGSDPALPRQALGDPTGRQAIVEGVNPPAYHQALFGRRSGAIRRGRSPLTRWILSSSP